MSAESPDNVVPVQPIPVWLARLGIFGTLGLFVFVQLFGGSTVSAETQGDATIYTATSSLRWVFMAVPVLTGILATVFSRASFVCLALHSSW